MWIKRTEQDWHYIHLGDFEESEELNQIMESAILSAEILIDVLLVDDVTKCVLEIAWVTQRIREMRKYTGGIDRYKQQIQRLLMTYEK